MIITHVHAQGVKQSVMSVCLFISSKIARSGDLGIWETRKYNEILKKLASLCFESVSKAYERCKHCVFIGHTYRFYQLQGMCCLLMCTT